MSLRDELVALADRWERIAQEHGVRQFTGNDHLLFANELRAVLATPTPPAAEVGWQPIETAPKVRTPMIVVRGVLESGYVTDPWCVWWQEGEWQRWPHEEQPTHWHALHPFQQASGEVQS